MKKYLIQLLLFVFIWFTYAVTIEHPKWEESWSVSTDSRKNIFVIVNENLWFALGLVLIIVLLYWWYLLITSEWDANQIKTSNKLLTYGFVWLIVAIWSYFIIKLLLNLYD